VLQVTNMTPFAVERSIQYDGAGRQIWVVVTKGTFTIQPDGSVEPAQAQEPVALTARYAGPPGASQLLRDAELVPAHPGTDVVLNAVAHAPQGHPVRELHVSVEVGPLAKTLVVTGKRHWERGLLGLTASSPEPFVALPLRWEHAFGGSDPRGNEAEPRNAAGCSFFTSAGTATGGELPRIEAPKSRIHHWRERPAPAGFGAVAPGWSPRRERAGTFDESWSTERAPLWPVDYDERFHVSAAEGLWAPEGLRGGETVTLTNLSVEPVLRFMLPRIFLGFATHVTGSVVHHRPALDRVIIEPELRRVLMVWRTSLALGPRVHEVVRTVVTQKKTLDDARR
jgi:hypothetical protein